ncbi:hypothetical protein RD792_009082 [Penstemon davidsonii]|uniref:Cytochrome P450 n=1 Tax=Penstemon davidsonii TaxID=160366 RepID=A0ABR0DAY4_9LAMI|nr:hypothetical protein RD792_009082 [Penstemon davidsonii]
MNLQIDSPVLQISISILTLSTLYLIWKWIKSGTKIGFFPPGARGLPILGYLPFLREDLHNQFTELSHKYGPIYKLWLGNKLCVVISSPSLIKEVVRDHDTIFSNRNKSVAATIATFNANDIAWCPYGTEWRERRKLFVREMLSNAKLDASYNLRKDEVRKAIGQVYSKIGSCIEISELAFMIDINLVMSMCWGSSIEGEGRDNIAKALLPVVAKILDVLGKPNVSDYFPILARFDIQGIEKEMRGLMKRVECIIKGIIEDRIKIYKDKGQGAIVKEGRMDFLQMLVELNEMEDVKNIVIGGTDTSSTTVEWVMTELLRNPEAMKRVQTELTEVVGLNNIVEESHIPKLIFLDAVLKETMRIHPIGPFLTPRTPSETCTVGGYTVQKDSGIFINVWSIQRDPLIFKNPLDFNPDRFLGNSGKWDFSGNNFNYMPFGSGRRICAGLPLADRMVRYVLASLLHSFEWKLPKGENLDMSDQFGIVLRKRMPLNAVPIPRLSCSNLYA